MKRCDWVNLENEKYIEYHDNEWGVPEHDDYKLFELLILEGAQAGLSWSTILKKRENYREAYDGFDFEKIAKYDDLKKQELINNEGIVRNRRKIDASIQNAKVFIEIRKEFGSFDQYIWAFVDNKPIEHGFKKLKDVPAKTNLSEKISKDLKKRGMNFVGPTIIYAFMQAIGLTNDHTLDCFRYEEITKSEL